MPTAIAVTSPDLALPATDRQTPAAVVLQAPHLQPLDDALTETSAVLEHHGHIVALYSSACPPDHIRRLHTLRAVLESDRIAILPMDLPPLGVAVLARQLRQLSLCDISPGLLACAARLLSHYIHAGALLGSVGGLDRVEVDLRSHVKSWLPGAHFAVLAHPDPQLHHVDRHRPEAGLPAPGYGTRLAIARGQLGAEWVEGVLAPAWQVQGVYDERLPAESARWWGTQKLIEFAAAIPDLTVLHGLVSSVRREDCRWCGLELIGDRCAFCAAPVPVSPAASVPGNGAPVGAGRPRAGGPAAIGAPRAARAQAATAVPAPGPTDAPPAAGFGPPPGGFGPAPDMSAAPAVAPGAPPAPEAPPSPLQERGLSPVAPSGVPADPGASVTPGVPLVPGAPAAPRVPRGRGERGEPGRLDVRGPDVSGNPYAAGAGPYATAGPGGPYAAGAGGSYAPGDPGVPGMPGGPGVAGAPGGPGVSSVPGFPYGPEAPRVPGIPQAHGGWDLPGHPDLPRSPDLPGDPRTVARVR
ncbi:hypothetical protein ACIQNI_02210 [Streptomyces sp. NPDC091266]|uniref:hypothetical protein n=1 Tax=Streptomyces sp. NPDC091266 TaxID=3365978 RepID=UPI00380FBF48